MEPAGGDATVVEGDGAVEVVVRGLVVVGAGAAVVVVTTGAEVVVGAAVVDGAGRAAGRWNRGLVEAPAVAAAKPLTNVMAVRMPTNATLRRVDWFVMR